ncbi:hypothetical protein IGB42_02216 [Andreprevotia sp. IGB-42]|uniref:DUF2917 domain-containing protein n=1 Tax=Andreprevotia sp. IGB-42 TaxID=2497473 RepID=UPI00135B2E3F|nr:DUF2917 domain-containing protein [Andreprevotia sp. IGB-42]KAF0813287.1 hypothetical protein IGB42_02216 [Andreprevotia sp. IGB-42]
MPLLAPDELLSLDKIRGRWIHCERGLLWLTVDGNDIILKSGMSCRVNTQQRVVIQALSIARFAILENPVQQPGARSVRRPRLGRRLLGFSVRLGASPG